MCSIVRYLLGIANAILIKLGLFLALYMSILMVACLISGSNQVMSKYGEITIFAFIFFLIVDAICTYIKNN